MNEIILLALVIVGVPLIYYLINRKEEHQLNKATYIENFIYPKKINESLKEKYPFLSNENIEEIVLGLKQYFLICSLTGNSNVSMPSQAVDLAWHEFILFTKKYNEFCELSFGRFLHHVPAEEMKSPDSAQKGIKLAWKVACKLESIDAVKPNKLPLLFSIDDKLNIPNGFVYKLNCNPSKNEYCAGGIGCASGCTGASCGSV